MPKRASKKSKKNAEPSQPDDEEHMQEDAVPEEDEEEDDDFDEDCANLTLPNTRIAQMLRKQLAGKRFSGENGIYTTGAIEHVINAIMVAMKSHIPTASSTGKCKRASQSNLLRAIRSDPCLSRVFSYTFSPSMKHKLRITPTIFLNGDDAKAYKTKREMERDERKKAREVPAVDEA